MDEEVLREKYIAASRKYHPDLYTLSGAREQLDAEEKSSIINEAYRILKTPVGRANAVIALLELSGKDEAPLSPEFLMEMMELNELKEEAPEQAKEKIKLLRTHQDIEMKQLFDNFDQADPAQKAEEAKKLLPVLARIKYLERLEN